MGAVGCEKNNDIKYNNINHNNINHGNSAKRKFSGLLYCVGLSVSCCGALKQHFQRESSTFPKI